MAVRGEVEVDVPPSGIGIRPLGQPGDLGWVVLAHGELYAAEYGWAFGFEALVARIVADYAERALADDRPAVERSGEAAWVAELDGQRVGCVFCVRQDDEVAQLRILLVDPVARGRGAGARLVEQCVGFARQQGYRQLVLWTNDPLVIARRIYLAAGFQLTGQQPHRHFGVDLIGQTYALDLTAVPGAPVAGAS